MNHFGLAPLALLLAGAACGGSALPAKAETRWCKQKWLSLTGPVVDDAGILRSETEADLAVKLRQLERRSGGQFVIATVASLQGQPITEYSVCLGRHWGVGQDGSNRGVMFLVAPNERKARIEVGYGLEKVLRDEEAGRIMREAIIPRFLAGDLPGGIEAGADAIVKELQ